MMIPAMLLDSFGSSDAFRPGEIELPPLRSHEVRIRMSSSSVNPIDVKIRSGAVPTLAPEFPAVLHGDACGQVEAVGADVQSLAPGDRVAGIIGGFRGTPGALATHAHVDARLLAKVPSNLTSAIAGALPIVGITAWEAVVERGNVKAGETVLVTGGTGGVGHVAVQFATAAGAKVFATVSTPEKARIVTQLGATPLLYPNQDAPDLLAKAAMPAGFDAVIDTVGGPALAQSLHLTRAEGRVVTIAARSAPDLSPAHAKGLTLHAVFVGRSIVEPDLRPRIGRAMMNVLTRAAQGTLSLRLSKRYAWQDVGQAHAALEAGGHVGKIGIVWE